MDDTQAKFQASLSAGQSAAMLGAAMVSGTLAGPAPIQPPRLNMILGGLKDTRDLAQNQYHRTLDICSRAGLPVSPPNERKTADVPQNVVDDIAMTIDDIVMYLHGIARCNDALQELI